MTQESFTIDKVVWHTRIPGNPEPREHIVKRFYAIARFLQEHGLTKRTLVTSADEITDDFALHSEDLTELGMRVIKSAYDRWLRRLDRGGDPENTSMLKKALDRETQRPA